MSNPLNNKYQIFDKLPDHIEDSNAPWTDLVREDFHVAVYRDAYPVTDGHLLFVPKYNNIGVLASAFDDALRYGQQRVAAREWDGFNIGMNYGTAAGQTVAWPHVHLIPRRDGDVDDPSGGIRGIIPGKAKYQ
jgi:diadenosine tetraphosphate (Ap4A) HIT family hydrolase